MQPPVWRKIHEFGEVRVGFGGRRCGPRHRQNECKSGPPVVGLSGEWQCIGTARPPSVHTQLEDHHVDEEWVQVELVGSDAVLAKR